MNELEEGRFSLAGFYERRARRILPALFVVTAFSFALAWVWMLPNQMKDFSQSLVAVSLFVSNILFWREDNYFSPDAEEKPLLHTWSLAVEEQYYLLFPVFMILFWRLGRRNIYFLISILTVLSFALSEWAWRNMPTANFYMAPTRAWELFVGSLSAFLISKRFRPSGWVPLVGLAGVFFSILTFDESTPFPSYYTLIPVLGTAAIILFSTPQTLVFRFLSNRALVSVGLISYSVYLWHQPLFAFVRIRVGSASIAFMLFISLASLLMGYLSWRYVENPFRNKRRFNRRFVFFWSGTGLITLFFVGMIGHYLDGFQSRISKETRAIAERDIRVFEEKVSGCWDLIEKDPDISGGCKLGLINGSPDFVLIGDSHAGAIQNEISTVAQKYKMSGIGLSYRSCPPLQNVEPRDRQSSSSITCRDLRNNFFSDDGIEKLPEYVVVAARWPLLIEKERYINGSGYKEGGGHWDWDVGDVSDQGYSVAMARKISSSLSRLVSAGKTVVIIYPIPEMGWSVPEYLAKIKHRGGSITDETASDSYNRFLQRASSSYAALDAVGDDEGVIRVYPEDIFCGSGEKLICHAVLNGQPLYYDDDHLSAYGAKLLSQEIIKSISRFRNNSDMKSDRKD